LLWSAYPDDDIFTTLGRVHPTVCEPPPCLASGKAVHQLCF